MLIDRYPAEDVFARVPELADQTDPVLAQLDRLLEDDALFQAVWAGLVLRYRLTAVHGRRSTPAEVILRLLVVKHLYAWSYQETEERVADSLVLRWFCRVYFRRVPDATTLLRWAQTIQPQTLHRLTDRAAQLAAQARVTRGRKLRVDGTVVETTIHHPTDSGLLGDGVRVLTRLIKRAQPLVGAVLAGTRDVFRDRSRTMRQTLRALHRLVRRTGEAVEAEQRQLYQHLIQTTEQVVQQARQVRQSLEIPCRRLRPGAPERRRGERLHQAVNHFVPLVEQVIHQARTRVLEGSKIPAQDKIVSLFEPHTRILQRRKTGLPQIARETIRQVLHEHGYSYQRTRTWCRTGYALRVRKSGTVTVDDPQTPEKRRLIELAYEQAEAAGIVQLNQDEAGPYQAIPQPGGAFQAARHPAVQPHEYERGGTAKLLTLFRPATGEVRAKGVVSATNAVLHPWRKPVPLADLGRDREAAPGREPATRGGATTLCTLENVALAA